MNNSKYHTIDPLILQTLNLNERRMNHILDILHGRPTKQYPVTERKLVNKTHLKDNSSATIEQEESLPPILLNHRKNKQSPTLEKIKPKSHRIISQNKSSDRLVENKPHSQRKNVQREDRSHSIRNSEHRIEEVKRRGSHRASTIQVINWSEGNARTQEEKRQQLMQDYLVGKLKKSKSNPEINPKDVYRIEIEELVAQLTPIEQLQEADKRMQRLKKRTKHLYTFDKNYYSKLNQHDLVVLS